MPTLHPNDWRGQEWLWWLAFWAILLGAAIVTAVMVFVWWYYQ